MLSSAITITLALAASSLAHPLAARACSKPAVRREWRSLTSAQKATFHAAVKCLKNKFSTLTGSSITDLYTDFTYIHNTLNLKIHEVAVFLPWHRYFVHIRELEMAKCGYTDPIPYWNWSLDGDDWFGSSIWSNSSFGGNGNATNGYCVSTGPYADIQLTYPMNHCLYRDLNLGSDAQEYISPAYITAMNSHDNYIDFNTDLIYQPHNLVHFSVNGEMLQQTSPNDPVFWVHHANIDRLWTLWQGRNKTRLIDYGGNTVQGQSSNDSTKYPLATLQDIVNMMGIAGMVNLTVGDTMDTLAGPFCYTYDA